MERYWDKAQIEHGLCGQKESRKELGPDAGWKFGKRLWRSRMYRKAFLFFFVSLCVSVGHSQQDRSNDAWQRWGAELRCELLRDFIRHTFCETYISNSPETSINEQSRYYFKSQKGNVLGRKFLQSFCGLPVYLFQQWLKPSFNRIKTSHHWLKLKLPGLTVAIVTVLEIHNTGFPSESKCIVSGSRVCCHLRRGPTTPWDGWLWRPPVKIWDFLWPFFLLWFCLSSSDWWLLGRVSTVLKSGVMDFILKVYVTLRHNLDKNTPFI